MGNSTHIQMKKTLYFCSVILWFVSFDHDYHTYLINMTNEKLPTADHDR